MAKSTSKALRHANSSKHEPVEMSQFILYLEPAQGSKLYEAARKFQTISSERLGWTDAHAYHPHCSLTGFWELMKCAQVNRSDDPFGISLVEKCLASFGAVRGSTKALPKGTVWPDAGTGTTDAATIEAQRYCFPTPVVRKPLIPVHNRRCLILPLVCPPPWSEFTKQLTAAFDASEKFTNRARAKRLDHISLAYFSPAEETQQLAVEREITIRAMEELANETFASYFTVVNGHAGGNGNMNVSASTDEGWDVVYYELIKEAKKPLEGEAHVFREVKRWRVV
ncbi:hypothetical protein BC832DRAFT_210364 [Gaertneriomyces semiglobifer]|nr:hypothetical protein BC832DRAFT_210364 [Gaertneriomyces semiglobifer]